MRTDMVRMLPATEDHGYVPAVAALALSLILAFAPPDAEAPVEIEPAPHPQPPPPSIEFPPPIEGPTRPPPEDEIELDTEGRPTGTTPPGEIEGVEVPDPDEPDEDEPPIEWNVDERTLGGMPYAPTAARKSAVRRGNDVLVRSFRKPVYSVAAAARLGVQLGGGREVLQPFAWGLAAQVRLHFARVVKSRFGIEIHAGHTRWQQRDEFEVVAGEAAKLTRISLLSHTDVTVGPSFEIPIGAVFLQLGASGGFAISTLSRALSSDPLEDEQLNEFGGLLRGGLSLGIPIANGQGLAIGSAIQQVFSNREVLVDPYGPADGRKVTPFDTWLESYLAYQVWF
jgi:hypothetical protein